MHLSLTAAGPATPELVWERYARPARWSEWSPQIRRVDCADEEIRAGSTGRVHGPPGVAVDFTVLAVDPVARTWSWRVRVLVVGVRLHLEHGVEADGLGVRTWLRLHGPAPVVVAYAPVARWAPGPRPTPTVEARPRGDRAGIRPRPAARRGRWPGAGTAGRVRSRR